MPGRVSPGFLAHVSVISAASGHVTVLAESSSGFGGSLSVLLLSSLEFLAVPAIQGSCDLVTWALLLIEPVTFVRRESARPLRVDLGPRARAGRVAEVQAGRGACVLLFGGHVLGRKRLAASAVLRVSQGRSLHTAQTPGVGPLSALGTFRPGPLWGAVPGTLGYKIASLSPPT